MNIENRSRAFLIVDYNLSRIEDVRSIKNYVAEQYQMAMVLIRPNPGRNDFSIADHVIDLDPLDSNFVTSALTQIRNLHTDIVSGLVFSDNAVHQGADLLKALGVYTDSAEFARNAFCKFLYREQEQKIRPLLEAQNLFVPDYQEIHDSNCLQSFIERNPLGVVIKPKQEGNNRGVIVLRNPDETERNKALAEVDVYMKSGVIAEQLIPYQCEYSFDGIGDHFFITEKFSVRGRYPVEIGQMVPAAINHQRASAIIKAGALANLIVGQSKGAFHNEILVSDDDQYAAVVEANRRPAGMKIWTLASLVFEQNLYARWVDSVIKPNQQPLPLIANGCAMTIMLPPVAPMLAGSVLSNLNFLIEDLKNEFGGQHPFVFSTLAWISCDAIATENKFLHFPPRDNSDFIASLVIRSSLEPQELKPYFEIIRSTWNQVLHHYLHDSEQLLA